MTRKMRLSLCLLFILLPFFRTNGFSTIRIWKCDQSAIPTGEIFRTSSPTSPMAHLLSSKDGHESQDSVKSSARDRLRKLTGFSLTALRAYHCRPYMPVQLRYQEFGFGKR
jgi:hypothetical protein